MCSSLLVAEHVKYSPLQCLDTLVPRAQEGEITWGQLKLQAKMSNPVPNENMQNRYPNVFLQDTVLHFCKMKRHQVPTEFDCL